MQNSVQVHGLHSSDENPGRASHFRYVTSLPIGPADKPPRFSTNENACNKPARPIMAALACRAGTSFKQKKNTNHAKDLRFGPLYNTTDTNTLTLSDIIAKVQFL